MKKKTTMMRVTGILAALVLFSSTNIVKAYSTDEYSIEPASAYKQINENWFGKEDGSNIEIQVMPISGTMVRYIRKSI